MPNRVATRRDHIVEETGWGRLEWMVSGAQRNSSTLTVGRCYILPGMANPRHYHPNCDEVLHVIAGTLRHSIGDDSFMLAEGDSISIPQGTWHNAENVGTAEAICIITFSTSDRQVVGELLGKDEAARGAWSWAATSVTELS